MNTATATSTSAPSLGESQLSTISRIALSMCPRSKSNCGVSFMHPDESVGMLLSSGLGLRDTRPWCSSKRWRS